MNLPYCLEPEKVMWSNYPRPKNIGGRGVLNFVLNFSTEVADSLAGKVHGILVDELLKSPYLPEQTRWGESRTH